MEPERLKAIIEAALLASPKPLRTAQLAELFDAGQRPEPDAIGKALHNLAEDCQGRGIELVEVGSGFRYQVRTEVFPHLDALWTERPSRYSRALLETLALMAYRQPITRGEIEQIRGVSVATSILRTLEERDWVRVVGHRDVPGKPALYGTTKAFLDYFSLRSLDELPPLSALRDLDALEPQLDLDGSNNHDPAAVAATTSAAASARGPDNTDGDDQGAAGAGNGKSPASDAGGQPDTGPDTGTDGNDIDGRQTAVQADTGAGAETGPTRPRPAPDPAPAGPAAGAETVAPGTSPISDPDHAGAHAHDPDATVDPVDRN